MDFIGKLLVVLVLVLSVLFLTWAMVVYGTHSNLRTKAEELERQANEAQTAYENGRDKYNRLEVQLRGEVMAARQQLRKLEAERVSLVARNQAIEAELEELQAQRRTATLEVAKLQDENTRLAEDAAQRRNQIAENQQARDQALAAVQTATEEVHQLRGQLASTLERNRELKNDLQRTGFSK